MKNAAWTSLAFAGFLFSIPGCGGDPGLPVAPVSGKVTLDGAPLADAVVTFSTKERSATGRTGADGSYSLVGGAAIGTNKVLIQKVTASGGTGEDTDPGMQQAEAAAQGGSTKIKITSAVPDQYSDPGQSKLTFDVSEAGSQEADFPLQSK